MLLQVLIITNNRESLLINSNEDSQKLIDDVKVNLRIYFLFALLKNIE